MELKINANLIDCSDVVAVALSGGEDSMALLYALSSLASKMGFTLKAINIEHGIRGEESLRDTAFCVEECKKLNVEISCYSVDALSYSKTNGCSVEEGARILRYDCFKKAVNSGFANKIATAHHKSDVSETTLLNLFRGTGLAGAKGISETALDGMIIRPMLNVSKQEISQYVDYRNISYVHDSTNDNCDYTRNFLRNKVIPLIKEHFPSFENAICRFGEYAFLDDEYLYKIAKSKLITKNEKAYVPTKLEFPIFARTAILAMKHVGIKKDYTTRHIESLFSLAKLETGSQINLICGVVAVKEYDKIVLFKSEQTLSTIVFPFETGRFNFNGCTVIIEHSTIEEFEKCEKSTYSPLSYANGEHRTLYLSLENSENAVLRNPIESDVIKKFGGGSKPLKKYLTDLKISKNERKKIIILADGNNVLAVCGVEISPDVKILKTSSSVFKISVI